MKIKIMTRIIRLRAVISLIMTLNIAPARWYVKAIPFNNGPDQTGDKNGLESVKAIVLLSIEITEKYYTVSAYFMDAISCKICQSETVYFSFTQTKIPIHMKSSG